MHGLGNQGAEAEETLLAIIPNYPLRNFVLLCSHNCGPPKIGGLSPQKEHTLTTEYCQDLFELFVSKDQKLKEKSPSWLP